MKKSRTVELNISAERAWEAIGNRFGDNGLWASSLTSSHLTGDLAEGVERICMNKEHETVEKLTLYNPQNMVLAYEITSDLPPIIKTAKNRWSVKSLGANKSSMTSEVTSDLVWWATPLSPLMTMAVSSILTKAMDELKHWAETGEQHPRKKAYNVKFAKFVPQLT